MMIDTASIRARADKPCYQEGQARNDVRALCDALDKARDTIDNLHNVVKSHGASCDKEWRRANRLEAENLILRGL